MTIAFELGLMTADEEASYKETGAKLKEKIDREKLAELKAKYEPEASQ